MGKFSRQIALFLGLSLIVTLIRFPYGSFVHDIFRDIKTEIQSQGVVLNAKKVQPRFPLAVGFEELSLLFNLAGLPFPLFFDKAVVSLEILPLLLLRTSVVSESEFYSGRASARYTSSFVSSENTLRLLLKHIQLESHPLLRGLGISGRLSLDLSAETEDATTQSQELLQGQARIKLSLDAGSYKGGHTIRGLLKLPRADDVRANIEVKKSSRLLSIDKAQVFSTLGNASLAGVCKLGETTRQSAMDLSLEVHLTQAGIASLGGYLALLAKASVEAPPADYRLSIKKEENSEQQPVVSASPL